MNEPMLARPSDQRNSGIIDTLSAGYAVVNRRIWVILIPIFLDLFLLLGPRVSVAPLVGDVLGGIDPAPLGAQAEELEATEEIRLGLIMAAEETNVLSLLSPGQMIAKHLGVPSVVVLLGGQGPLVPVGSWVVALGLIALVLAAGLLLGAAYYSLLAQQVREGRFDRERWLLNAWVAWKRIAGLLLILGAIAVVVGVPVTLLLALLALVSPVLSAMGLAFVLVGLVWLQIYLFFAPDAIFLSQVHPVAAIKRSVVMVRSYLWPALLLIGLIWLIMLGMSLLWLQLGLGALGAIFSIVGNAYVATGLMAASMVFYWERIGKLSLPGEQSPAASGQQADAGQ